MKLLIGVGALWPFLLVAGFLAALMAGVGVSDGTAYGALSASAIGLPAVAVAAYRGLPDRWSEHRRVAVAGLLALPLFATEVVVALLLLGAGMYSHGFAPA